MATYNFGMLTAGMPDPTMRQASSAIGAPENSAWLADWQKRYDAAVPAWNAGGGGMFNLTANQVAGGGVVDPNVYKSSPAFQNADGSANFQAVADFYTNGPSGYWDDSARRALDAEKAKQDAAFQQQAQAYGLNQQAQQQAYNTSGGGTFLGGNINASYATPQTGLDPNSSLNGMLTQQPWSMPGFGGPTGGASQSGFGTNTGNAWGGSQPSGWGGPFTAKNPWAAS